MGVIQFIKRQIKEILQGGTGTLVSKFNAAKQLKVISRISIGGIAVLVCYALKPFIKIRFGHIYTSRIGHLCYNMDNYLSDRQSRDSNELGVFKRDNTISNTTIYAYWGKKKNIFLTNFADFPLWFLETFIPSSDLLISFHSELHPEFSVTSSTQPNINILEIDELEREELFQKNKITSPYICLHNRDSAYLDHYGSDGNHHDFRDFDFSDFELGIERITESGIMAVRLGEKIKAEYRTNNQKFVSITESKRSDFADVALIAKCLFFVGCNNGFSMVSKVFRKPELLINYIPFTIPELSAWPCDSLVLPKKLYKISEERYLRFAEMAVLPYDIHHKGDFFGNMGIRVENNSQEEIADAIMEMWMRITGKWKDSESQHQLQDEFWSSVSDVNYSSEVHNRLGTKISSTFLEKNHYLI
jgi:putative glycosyltransferase (TIGR04372 family)